MPDSVGRLHCIEQSRPRVSTVRAAYFLLIFLFIKVGENCYNCHYYSSDTSH